MTEAGNVLTSESVLPRNVSEMEIPESRITTGER